MQSGDKIKLFVLAIGLPAIYFILFFDEISPKTNYQDSNNPWQAPESADTMINPVHGDKLATQEGEELYTRYCERCHGKKGEGDGIGGMGSYKRPADLTTEIFQAQTDGAIYWKITTGRRPMPSYRNRLTDLERWCLVNYLRTMKK